MTPSFPTRLSSARMAYILDPMRRRARRHASPEGFETAIPRLMLAARSLPESGRASVYEPVACLILQSAKQVEIGDRVLRYDHASYFVASLDLPAYRKSTRLNSSH